MSINLESPVRESARGETRRRAILEVAREVFLAQGYAATSMSEIALRLGGSKGTLYNYFRSKEELFAAFMADTCKGAVNAIFGHALEAGPDLRAALVEIGAGLLGFLLGDEILPVHRLVVAEAGRFPEIGRLFYETGPRQGELQFEAFFQRAIDAGQLPPGDAFAMGRRFKDLVLSDIYSRRQWGVLGRFTRADIRRHAEESTDLFLRLFG